MKNIIVEAFKEFKLLNEGESFNMSDKDQIKALDKFMSGEYDDGTEMIIDVEAENENDLKDSYVDDIILECPICKTKIYKNPANVHYTAEQTENANILVNEGEECPHCQCKDGFKVVGKVAQYSPEVIDTQKSEPEQPAVAEPEITPEDIPNADLNPESDISSDALLSPEDNIAAEKELGVDTEAEDLEDEEESDDKKDKKANESLKKEAIDKTDNELESDKETEDINVDDIDEAYFDNLVNQYLKEVYENVKSYSTTSGDIDDENNKMYLEGKITFNSGKEKATRFLFEAANIKDNKIKFYGMNEMFTKGKKAFALTAAVDKNKLLPESLTYRYKHNNKSLSESKKLYGTVRVLLEAKN